MRVWVYAAFAAAAVFASSSAQAADQGLLKITGAKQGAISGAGVQVLDFSYGVTSPTDSATGLATGKRMHKPFTVTMPWSAATPQLYQAVINNENLTSVEFTDGGPSARFSVKLTNAHISDIEVTDANSKDAGIDPIVTVTFTFQQIQITDTAGNKSASDDWEARM